MKPLLWFRWLLIIILTICLMISIMFFFHGSFEMFPTLEQQSKFRVAIGFMVLGFTLLLAFLGWFVIKKRRRDREPADPKNHR